LASQQPSLGVIVRRASVGKPTFAGKILYGAISAEAARWQRRMHISQRRQDS
jgi:hypothetical protein